MRRPTRGLRRPALSSLLAVILGAALLQAVVAVAPSTAAAGEISTYTGGLGRGQPTNVAQKPDGVAVFGDKVYVADIEHRVVRMVDTTTGEETVVAGPLDSNYWGDVKGLSLAVDSAGTLYVSNEKQNRVYKLGAGGEMVVVAGTGVSGSPNGDGGAATAAKLGGPAGLAFDADDNLYIADADHYKVRKVVRAGALAGTISTHADFSLLRVEPKGLAVDDAGRLLVSAGHAVYRVDMTAVISLYAGRSEPGSGGDGGPAVLAQLSDPTGLVVDGANLYIADTGNHRVRKVDADGNITAYAGSGVAGYGGDCSAGVTPCPTAVSAKFNKPRWLASDGAGALYAADTANNRLRKVGAAPAMPVTTAAGNGTLHYGGDGGPADRAQLGGSHVATSGDVVYIADTQNHRVRRVGADGTITTYAGTGAAGDAGDCSDTVTVCPATSATLSYPSAVAVDRAGNLYVAMGNRVRKVDVSGRITAFAGTGAPGSSGDDGPATAATFSYISGMAVDRDGSVFVADWNKLVRKVGVDGIITAYAGIRYSSGPSYGGDCSDTVATCPATSARLAQPSGMDVDAEGNLYIADAGNQRIRRVEAATSKITTVAGIGTVGSSGDGGPATEAKLNSPTGVAFDPEGNLYIADRGNATIRRVDGADRISTFAGTTNNGGFSGDGGPATSARFSGITGVAADVSGAVYVGDGPRVRRIAGPDTVLRVAADTRFGTQPVGTTSEARTTTLSNTGPAGLAVSEVTVVGGHLGDFAIASDSCGGTTVAAGATCAIAVRFAPTAGGPRRADLRIAYDAPDSPRLVPLTGTGATLAVTPASGAVFGGTKVVISGPNMGRAGAVAFGGTPAFSYRVDSPTQITAVSPPRAAGPVQVVVSGPSGATLGKGTFNFVDATWASTDPLPDIPLSGHGAPVMSSSNGRSAHTATLLTNGKVLIAGGATCPGCGEKFASAVLYDPATRTWSTAADMTVARSHHSATRLPDGRVLVAGGFISSGAALSTASSEVYDPVADRWASTQNDLTEARAGHTATLLDNGDVVVAGGVCATSGEPVCGPVSPTPRWPLSRKSAELYKAGAWAPVGDMTSPHTGHSATLVETAQGPRVLVAGGWRTIENASPGAATQARVSVAELYDPGTKTWSATAALDSCQGVSPSCTTRQAHSATRLGDGRVLVAGGFVNSGWASLTGSEGKNLASAQIYDPAAGTWSPAGSMREGRAFHVSALVDTPPCGTNCGRVMVAGGQGHCLELGQQGRCSIVAWVGSAEIYDPTSDSWSPGLAMADARSHASGTALPDGTVLVVAGAKDWDRSHASAELFRPVALQQPVTITGVDPAVGPTHGGSVTFRGFGLFSPSTRVTFGGSDARVTFVSDTEVTVTAPAHAQGTVPVTLTTQRGEATSEFTYGPGAWAPTGSMKVPRAPAYMLAIGGPACRASKPSCGRVVAAGKSAHDIDANWQANDRVRPPELYDPGTATWSLGSTPGIDFDAIPALVVDGPACRTGEPQPGYCGKVLMYGYPGANLISDRVMRTFLWDPDANAVSAVTELGTVRYDATFSLLDGPPCHAASPPAWCGRILMAGGNTPSNNRPPLRTAELFDPANPGWTPTGELKHARTLHTASGLPNGEVLVAGGSGSEVLASAETYNPQSGEWTLAGEMAEGRHSHTATVLDRQPCGLNCDQVLVVGGNYRAGVPDQPFYGFLPSAERYDPVARTWHAAGLPRVARVGNSATRLSDGTVLVAGLGAINDRSGQPDAFPPPVSSAELYDPVADTWRWTSNMASPLGAHGAALLDGPACKAPSPPPSCGKVLVAGGSFGGELFNRPIPVVNNPTTQAHLYSPAPRVQSLVGSSGPTDGGTPVVIKGMNFAPGNRVTFDGAPAAAVNFDSPNQLSVVSPPHAPGWTSVSVDGDGGTSATTEVQPAARFHYVGAAGQIIDLEAVAGSESSVDLSFSAPDDGTEEAPATRYVVKQARSEITSDAAFESARTILGPEKVFEPAATIEVHVSALAPATTYHYAVRALNHQGEAGPRSNNATATTRGTKPSTGSGPSTDTPTGSGDGAGTVVGTSTTCTDVPPGAGEVAYPSGYSLLGLPAGTAVPTAAPMYSWFDLGAGGAYSARAGSDGVEAGRGYWAWFSCPVAVDVPATSELPSFGLGAYRASMVGNPTGTGTAAVTGHDFAATWDQTLNDGAGGYHLSGYRQAQPLAVGQGAWVFSYQATTIAFAVA